MYILKSLARHFLKQKEIAVNGFTPVVECADILYMWMHNCTESRTNVDRGKTFLKNLFDDF